MSAPYEVIVGALTLWLAPVGTAFPATNAAPSGSWIKVGTNGTDNYDEKGVTVKHGQTIGTWTPAGSTAARKAFRTQETLEIDMTLVDLSMAQYAQALNLASVSTQTGPPATQTFSLLQGTNVQLFALLARGASSVNDTLPAQYQVPIVYQNASPAPAFAKGAPAGLDLSFMALKDAATGFGTLVTQTA